MSILDLPCIGHTPEIDWQKLQAQNLEVSTCDITVHKRSVRIRRVLFELMESDWDFILLTFLIF